MSNLTYIEKVQIFVQELINAKTLHAAILSANRRGVNAAFCEDEEAFYEALEIVGNPDN